MNIKPFLLLPFLLLTNTLVMGKYLHPCQLGNRNGSRLHEKTTIADITENNYDVKHLKFKLKVTDSTTFIVGDVTTTAMVVASGFTVYTFELDSSVILDSAKFNGILTTVARTGNVCKINLSTSLTIGSYFNSEIFYHGTPTASGGFFNALTESASTHGTKMVFSLSDPYAAKNWWPAKQSLDDKIDTVDMFVTVPRGDVDGSNGVLVGVDTTTIPGFSTYHWQTHYPIDYYLISITVSKFAEDKSMLHFSGSTDSMLIQNFFIDTATFYPAYKANFDSIGLIIDYYSSLFGRYPFWKEKYGVCYTTLAGGMEHQTMTTIGVPNTYIIAHELCHQWFGDNVTYSRWGDVWLSEGFATFSEQLFLSHFQNAATGKAHRQLLLNSYALAAPCGSVYITDTSSATTIFAYDYVYAKAEGVVNMLRYIAPADSLFFSVLKTYQYYHAGGNASTADLKSIADSIYGMNLDTFFNQWIYGQGYPIFKVSWDQFAGNVYVKLIQTVSCSSSVPLFNTPVELQLHSAAADTFIKVNNNADTTIYVFPWSPTTLSVLLNPDVWTILKQNGGIVRDTNLHSTALKTGGITPDEIHIFPNPTENNWQIENAPENTKLTLFDNKGRVIWEGKSNKNVTSIPGNKIPAGDYLLNYHVGNETTNVKLVHW